MPNPPGNNPAPPGSVGDSKKFPQYGLDTKSGKVVVAQNYAQKVAYSKKGFFFWFDTRKAAEKEEATQKGFGSGNVSNPLSGIDSIGASIEAFYDTITDGKLWRSISWITLGALLLLAGIFLWFRGSDLYKSAEGAIGSAAKVAAVA